MDASLADELFFSKEAADYLGITTQRLNTLVKEGKIKPLKKSPSGTVFLLEELKKRKEELRIFSCRIRGSEEGMFKLDTEEKNEAVNFATLMNILEITEQKLDPLFSKFCETVDVSIPLIAESVVRKYADFFNIDISLLYKEYDESKKAFLTLRETDEIIKRGSQDYPLLLASTEQAPRFLYIRGKKSLLCEKRTVALVGSRQASERSKESTKNLAIKLGENGITVISGLARGIDVSAHKAILNNNYNTIAVLGTNLNQYYPMENKDIQREIEQKGLVVSQFSPANKTQRWFFPLRNGVMSGLSLATVIMEAGETSGALKQADFALKQGRKVMIPQSALNLTTITWPAKYVERGAQVVRNSKDVLKILSECNIFNTIQGDNRQLTMEDYLRDYADQDRIPRINLMSVSGN